MELQHMTCRATAIPVLHRMEHNWAEDRGVGVHFVSHLSFLFLSKHSVPILDSSVCRVVVELLLCYTADDMSSPLKQNIPDSLQLLSSNRAYWPNPGVVSAFGRNVSFFYLFIYLKWRHGNPNWPCWSAQDFSSAKPPTWKGVTQLILDQLTGGACGIEAATSEPLIDR